MGLSIRAYARHRGVSHVAVKKAIDTGRITPESDGTINAEQADRDWAQNTLVQGKRSVPPRATPATTAATATAQPAREAPEPGIAVPSAGGTSLLQARTVNEVVKAQTNKVRLARLKGDLVDRNQAVAHVFKLARSERDAWLNWPARVGPPLAATLGVDAHTLHVALETAVREHLAELGELRPRVD
jgi:hypothetical protein